ncbi:hypothetical protein [Streptomyces sp. NPDC049590]|uniref:hypothetical protein n=1 Tax=Streptomyces sp. NPDC049590 TaxID=3154834 RepID=UPI003438B5C6
MSTAATHLRTIALHWVDLADAAGQPALVGGFGQGLKGYLAALDERARLEAAWARADERADTDPNAPGQRPIPVRLHILDTMRVIEAALVACADDIAHAVQRAPITAPSARRTAVAPYASQREADIAAADRHRSEQLALADQRDPRRWRYTGRRTASYAALWLLARVERAPGPCRRLTDAEERRISAVAAGAAERLERALDIAAQRRTLEQRHDCGGLIDVHGGEGRVPVAHCTGCGQVWTAAGAIAA